MWIGIAISLLIIIAFFAIMESKIGKTFREGTYSHSSTYITYQQPLKVGDYVDLFGGTGYDPLFLKTPSAHSRFATISKFINVKETELAAVARLESRITGDFITGGFVILRLCTNEQTWKEPSPVQIELINVEPDDNDLHGYEEGELIEERASLIIVSRLFNGKSKAF